MKVAITKCGRTIVILLLSGLIAVQTIEAGVSRIIQDRYRRSYENKALFLKIPIFSERQTVTVSGRNVRAEQGSGAARFKVGDQFRVLGIDFGGEEIKFKLGPISGAGVVELIFRFDAPLADSFPNSEDFDHALQVTFTEGLKYADLEDAKRTYVEDQFESLVREIASTAGISRELVLKTVAPKVPAYQDAVRDVDNLKGHNQDLAGQLAQSQSENRKLETESRNQAAEITKLRNANSSLQDKIDSSAAQLSRIGDELRDAKGVTQGYQKELANLQRSLNIKIDANRDLGSQIAELAQVMHKLQKDNEGQATQITALKTSLEAQKSQNANLLGENDDLKASNKQMRDTINTLTSKEDSLARQYIQLKQVKENLQTQVVATENLSTRIVEDKLEGGFHSGKANLYLRNILLGSLDWRFPEHISLNEQKTAEAGFSSESIDYVRVAPDERQILRSLGEKLKFQIKLSTSGGNMVVQSGKDDIVQEVAERDRATWQWAIRNQGTQDARLVLGVQLLNKNSDNIPVLQQEQPVYSASVVRQVRGYLQPIPVAVGALLGFLLFGIFGVFRRVTGSGHTKQPPPHAAKDSSTYIQKQL